MLEILGATSCSPANFSSRAAMMTSLADPAELLAETVEAALVDEMLVMPSSMPCVLEGDKFLSLK